MQASNETGLRAAGAEQDSTNASSEPKPGGQHPRKAAEDTLLHLCPSVLPDFPANFGMFPCPHPVFPFHAFCADKAEHPLMPSAGMLPVDCPSTTPFLPGFLRTWCHSSVLEQKFPSQKAFTGVGSSCRQLARWRGHRTSRHRVGKDLASPEGFG